MPRRTAHFCGISKITVEHEEGAPTSVLKAVDIRLEVSGNQDRSKFIDGKGLPRKEALKVITQTFVQGLIANVKHGHAKAWWKEGDHMRYIIEQLQKAFVATTEEPGESTMEY